MPGPKSERLLQQRIEAVPRALSNATPIFASKASGALLMDIDGNTFIGGMVM